MSNKLHIRQNGFRERLPDVSILMEYETLIRRQTSLVGIFGRNGVEGLYDAMEVDEFLDFIDYLVFVAAKRNESAALLEPLGRVLEDAGSEWALGERDGHAALEKRVPEGVVLAVNTVIEQGSSAGVLLAEAWHAAFGKNPDPEEAYEKAIKAVEEAGSLAVSPNNKIATLGTISRDMKAQKGWTLPIDSTETGIAVQMAAALWHGQESRHGGNGYRKPTHAEAESAVMLAVPLVQWFSSGMLSRE